MEIIYWTKKKTIIEDEEIITLEEYDDIFAEEMLGFVPDGNGFEVNMNDISYEDYLSNKERYEIKRGVLYDLESVEEVATAASEMD